MTDPNLPPERQTTYVDQSPTPHTTVNVNSERRGGGGAMPFILGGLVVLIAIIAAVLYFRGATPAVDTRDVDIDVNLPKMEAPKLPDLPTVTPPSAPPAN